MTWLRSVTTRVSQMFCNFVPHISHDKQFNLWKVAAMVGNIVVVGVLTHCTWIYSKCNLKATQINVQWILINKLLNYVSKLDHNTKKQLQTFVVNKVKM